MANATSTVVSPSITTPTHTSTATIPSQLTNPASMLRAGLPGGGTTAVIVISIVVVAVIVVFVAYLALTRMRRKGVVERASEDPEADALGLLLDLDTATGTIVPLRRVENFYISRDNKHPAIIVANPYAPPFTVGGKNLVIAVTAGLRSGYQIDVSKLGELGFAQIAIDAPEWHDTSDPGRSVEKLIERMQSIAGLQKGEIPLAPGTKLAFQVSPPRVILALLRQQIENIHAAVGHIVNLSMVVDQISNVIREVRVKEMAEQRKTYLSIGMAVGMVMLIASIIYYLLRVAMPH